jgi:hypothetical protein
MFCSTYKVIFFIYKAFRNTIKLDNYNQIHRLID